MMFSPFKISFMLLQVMIVCTHGKSGQFDANFIRWKRLEPFALDIQVKDNKASSSSSHRLLSSSHNKNKKENNIMLGEMSTVRKNKKENNIILSEMSTVRKCGPDGDARFPSIDKLPNKNCPSIGPVFYIPNVESCAAKCVERPGCRSWNYNKHDSTCIIYSQILQSKFNDGFISGDVDVPLTVMSDATVAATGGFVCSCLQNPKSVYVNPISNHSTLSQNNTLKEKVYSLRRTCIQQMGCKHQKDTQPAMSKCSSPPQRNSSLITISQRFGSSHFHFMVECLVRLATVPRELFHRKNLKVHILQDPITATWQFELLSIFGISKHNVVWGEVFANEIFVPSFTSCGAPSRYQVLSLRHLFLHSAKIVPSKNELELLSLNKVDDIVVVLIERTVARGLLNMDELRDKLTALSVEQGFTLKVYSDHEQATHHNQFTLLSMFSEASIIVAPHGAGLSNMIVSHPCSTIIEARERGHPKCYMHLAQTLGFKYLSGCDYVEQEPGGIRDNACVSGTEKKVTYKQELLTVGVNGTVTANRKGEVIVEVEGGIEGREEGEQVNVKIAITKEVPTLTIIDVNLTYGLVKSEVDWRRQSMKHSDYGSKEAIEVNSYSQCLSNAKDYFSSFVDSSGAMPLDEVKSEGGSSNGAFPNWEVPNGPSYSKLLKKNQQP